MRLITTRAELVSLARELGVRPNWHEPDEQNVGATVEGSHLDNAGFWPAELTANHEVSTGTDPHTGHITRAVTHPATGDTFCGSGCSSVELNVVLWRTDVADGRQVNVEPLACVNVATLLAWATGLDDASGRRIDWQHETRGLRDAIDEILERAGLEHPLGLAGIRDLVTQREGHLEHVRELEDRLSEVRGLADKLERNPDVSASVVRQLREVADNMPSEKRLTEARYRVKISREIYEYGEWIEDVIGGRPGAGVRQIVDEVGDRIGKMGGGDGDRPELG